MAIPLKKLNEIVASLIKTQTFMASIGSVADDTLWAQTAAKVLNGNSILIMPGPGTNQIVLKASAMIMSVPTLVKVEAGSDTPITSTVTIPPGARNDGTNYFFSRFITWQETPVLLANKFNHVYVGYDANMPNNLAIGVIANASAAEPDGGLLVNLGDHVSARQAVCYVDGTGRVTMLGTFPSIFNQTATVPSDTAPSFSDWAKLPTLVNTNVIQAQFSFAEGVGTGSVGQIAIKLGSDIIAFLAISPQLLKDSDVALTIKWNLMIGEPGAFLS